jgi:hypothetical protein
MVLDVDSRHHACPISESEIGFTRGFKSVLASEIG